MQIHEQGRELLRFKGSTPKVPPGAKGAVVAVTFAGGCQQRLEQLDALSIW